MAHVDYSGFPDPSWAILSDLIGLGPTRFREVIGKAIRRRRNHINWSQAELCKSVKITTRWLSDVELGKVRVDFYLFLNICDVMGVTPPELISGDYPKDDEDADQS